MLVGTDFITLTDNILELTCITIFIKIIQIIYIDFSIALGVYIYTMADVVLHLDIEDANTTTVSDIVDIIIQQKHLGLSKVAKNVFTIWMKSNVLGMLFNYSCNLII